MSHQVYHSHSSERLRPHGTPLRGYVDAAVEARTIESTDDRAELLAQRLAIAGAVTLVLMVWVSQLA